jgi:hypothetical protein
MNKPTRTPKQAALAAISALPDAASFEEIAYRLQVLEAAAAGTAEIEAGKGSPTGTSKPRFYTSSTGTTCGACCSMDWHPAPASSPTTLSSPHCATRPATPAPRDAKAGSPHRRRPERC